APAMSPACSDGSTTAADRVPYASPSRSGETHSSAAVENVSRVAPVRFLFPHLLSTDPRCISDPHFVAYVPEHVHKPMAVARCFTPTQPWSGQAFINPSGLARPMHQLPLPSLSALLV